MSTNRIRIAVLSIALGVPLASNGYRIYVQEPRQRDAELTAEAANLNITLGKSQSYLEGVSDFLKLQESSGFAVAPEVLQQAKNLAAERKAELEQAEGIYTSIKNESRTSRLILNLMVMEFGHITVTTGRSQLERFGSEIDSTEVSSDLKLLGQQLEKEEAVYEQAVADLAEAPEAPMPPENRECLCQLREGAVRIIQEAQRRADKLATGKTRACCEEHRQRYCRMAEEVRKRAAVLEHNLEEMERAANGA